MGFLNSLHAPNQSQQDPPKHLTPEQMRSFLAAKNGLSGVQHFDSGGAVNTGQTGGGLYVQDPGWLGNIHNGLTGIIFGGPSKFQAQGVPIQQGYDQGQINNAIGQSQSGLQQQGQFNQQMAGVNGIGNQQGVFNQLQGVSNGTGPNPAMAALNQATSNNIANQAALMAGQRGASANSGLIARQAAMQGANTQQQGVARRPPSKPSRALMLWGRWGRLQDSRLDSNKLG
jgi:hypothetical protein